MMIFCMRATPFVATVISTHLPNPRRLSDGGPGPSSERAHPRTGPHEDAKGFSHREVPLRWDDADPAVLRAVAPGAQHWSDDE